MSRLTTTLSILSCLSVTVSAIADDSAHENTSRGDALLETYFQNQVAEIEASTFAEIKTLQDWETKRTEYRRQLAEMLGLDPMPEKTPLEPVVTGTVEHDQFTVENLHFQSMPGLYVTGNLYVPKGLEEPAPAVLYVCGHGRVKENGVSYGNKVNYQHHAIWFARHGYVCLIIDTLQLGEIEGLHHGTYREGMWWWQSRGYTPAGVEAWNCIRSLDYLETRPKVDASRFGVTGRSGGGAYSWWIAALDERIKAAVPVAGICSLRNHLLGPYQTSPWSRGETHGHDGCVEGHCDCMYFINTYRWDFPMVAALVAPRALLISNTDKDRIFPLDGVYDVYSKAQRIYDLYGATDDLGLQICEGPHKDTQQLRVHAFQWMNKYLKGDEPLIDVPAEKLYEPEQLRVFKELPSDQHNTAIHDTFVPAAAEPAVPQSEKQWASMRDEWTQKLRTSVFAAWPDEPDSQPLDVKQTFTEEAHGARLSVYEFTSQAPYRLELYVATRPARELTPADDVLVRVLDEPLWRESVARLRGVFPGFHADSGIEATTDLLELAQRQQSNPQPLAVAFLVPRGVGPTAWTEHEKERIQIKRRLALLGETLDGMRAWDVLRGLRAIRELAGGSSNQFHARAAGPAAGWLLAASLFDESIATLRLDDLDSPESPTVFLNAQRTLHPAALLTLAGERASVRISTKDPDRWEYASEVSATPWFPNQILIEAVDADDR